MIGGAKGIGLGIDLGLVNQYNRTGSQSYIEPEVLDSLVGVWSAYGMTNDSPNRSTIKNKLSNKGGDFVISNAAFKLNSGFGEYEEDFTSWIQTNGVIASSDKVQNSITGRFLYFNTVNKKEDVPSFKVNITLGQQSKLQYNYIKEDGTSAYIVYSESGIYTIPASYFSKYTGGNAWFGFYQIEGTSTIEQIPSFEGAFVTDGVNDLITSTKTLGEMIGDSNDFTVISMIHQISPMSSDTIAYNNYFRGKSNNFVVRNRIKNYDKTGIYGYSISNLSSLYNINTILGDKEDYLAQLTTSSSNKNNVFSVEGFLSVGDGIIAETSQVAWYWTFIANRVLTTDEINQVIAYFNLDRTLKPDILCNTIKQGITNENHAEFGDKLIDYSGNGRDIQLNNIAWKGDSGIGKYSADFESFDWAVNISQKQHNKATISLNGRLCNHTAIEVDEMKVNIIGNITELIYWYIANPDDTTRSEIRLTSGINTLPKSYAKDDGQTYNIGFAYISGDSEITIEQIPSHAGALCLDGVNDFGKVTGMPIYKDYTFIIDYERISYTSPEVWTASVASKAHTVGQGAFLFMSANREVELSRQSISFGSTTTFNRDDFTRTLLYQSKYKCGDVNLTVGEGIDGDTLWLGTLRDNDYRFFNGAIYSLMSFPYSMSEFLIERQLKKHKLGTLYPNMVEFRPVIKSNASYDNIEFYYKNEKVENGTYLTVGSSIGMHIRLSSSPVNEIKSITVNGIPATFKYHNANNNIYQYDFNLTSKSPQNINITIDEYIRYEDIVQPYPVLLRFNDENGNEVSWGGKFRVGSTITIIGSAADSNLLPNIYNIFGLLLNDNQVTSSKVIVEKTMVFKAKSAYIFDNNEPNCILSPRLLRIPNSSYKILGYIPDISGHGNHGVIHNSAYGEGSGVNEDGSYQFDGVDDFVTIPTVTGGGKQVLMKVNNNTINSMLYDQRSSGASPNSLNSDFAIYNTNTVDNNLIAYQSILVGNTYIDGILNTNIACEDLLGVLHNITITCDIVVPNNGVVPNIGRGGVLKDLYSKVALYDFMLFDSISTDDKIKELNEYVGIEAKVELPPYYWDAYGKTNLDEDRSTIQQRGIAVGDYDLTNNNFAYDKISGFGGYEFAKFDNTSEWSAKNREDGIEVIERNAYSFTAKRTGAGTYFWDFNNHSIKTLNRPLTLKAVSNNNTYVRWEFKYRTAEKPDVDSTIILVQKEMTPNVPITVTLPYKTEQEITDLGVTEGGAYYLFYFDPTNIPIGEEYTIKMLPLYPNGLVYDGVTDYSENANIPAFTDYTYILKRELLNNTTYSCSLHKGTTDVVNGQGFVADYISQNGDIRGYSFGEYANVPSLNTDKIIYGTKTSVNGIPVNIGSGVDTLGMSLAKWKNVYKKMIFYKLILYPKTIPLLQINFLKNLMERDEIIDLNNKIFIQE